MYKVLIVEDEKGISEGIRHALSVFGMDAREVGDFHNIMAEFSEFAPHVVLMDISLPFMNGYYWCGEIRRISKVPIVFISSASDRMNIVMAMNMGADDFIAKPFDSDVLVAKLQALLRRSYDFSPEMPILEHRGALLNTGDGSFVYGGNKIGLSKNEYRILLILMKNKGRTVSREKLMEALWQTDEFVDENTLTVNVNRLRKKLSSAGLNDFIETKFGDGYIINR